MNWIQSALKKHKRGMLHKMLDVPKDINVPIHLLEEIRNREVGDFVWNYHNVYKIKITKLMKERANFALNMEKRLHSNMIR